MTARPVVGLSLAKVLVGLAVLGTGFFALSDDDFSRLTIAQTFAVHPRLDPSGTSWLPLPFWITGAAMHVLGTTFTVGRTVAVLEGILSVLLAHRAALWAGASREGAFLGALATVVLPGSARLGVSFQPEALTAGLVVLGAAGAGSESAERRVVAGAALGLACLCRYEAWAAAAAFAAVTLASRGSGGAPHPPAAVRTPSGARPWSRSRAAVVGAVALALLPLLSWMLHGLVTHGDALFFLHRVAAYKRALGASEPLWQSLWTYPQALLFYDPEVTLALAALAIAHDAPTRRRIPKRPVLVLTAVFAFLVAGRLLDGAPTHHPERALLSLSYGLCLVAGEGFVRLLSKPAARVRVIVVLVAVSQGVASRHLRPAESLAGRAPERAVGLAARRALGPDDRLAIDTPDYGYFAVMAAFGAPERAAPLETHDPREGVHPSPFTDVAALREALAARDATWLAAARPHWPVAREVGREVTAEGDLALFHAAPLR